MEVVVVDPSIKKKKSKKKFRSLFTNKQLKLVMLRAFAPYYTNRLNTPEPYSKSKRFTKNALNVLNQLINLRIINLFKVANHLGDVSDCVLTTMKQVDLAVKLLNDHSVTGNYVKKVKN